MSETFRVGDRVVFRNDHGEVHRARGIGEVTASNVSTVTAIFGLISVDVNAGSLAYGDWHLSPCTAVDYANLANEYDATRLRLEINNTTGQCDDAATLRAALAVINRTPRTCQTCTFWRPPYDDFGPGNCHNQTVRGLTAYGNETYPPPTPAEFGCNQWKAKQQPENGDDSDE